MLPCQVMNLVQLFGQNVRRERLAKGLSQDELAVLANMRRSYVSDLERGTRNPSIQALGRLAAVLEIEPARLLQS
jgi:transcriptional regulator with XRE-family HTH domain